MLKKMIKEKKVGEKKTICGHRWTVTDTHFFSTFGWCSRKVDCSKSASKSLFAPFLLFLLLSYKLDILILLHLYLIHFKFCTCKCTLLSIYFYGSVLGLKLVRSFLFVVHLGGCDLYGSCICIFCSISYQLIPVNMTRWAFKVCFMNCWRSLITYCKSILYSVWMHN